MRSSFASIAILVFESLQCRSAIRQAACELVRVRLRALDGMQPLGLIRTAVIYTIAQPRVRAVQQLSTGRLHGIFPVASSAIDAAVKERPDFEHEQTCQLKQMGQRPSPN